VIDHPLTNGEPDVLLLVTQNWNPGGIDGTYNNAPIGVWYNGTTSKWEIFNQYSPPGPTSAMPLGAAFNIKVVPATESTFVHNATLANISVASTTVDHPLTNSNPEVLLFVTQNWNPGGIGGTYNNAPIGVWFDNFNSKWCIFNENLEDMPPEAAFNVKATLPSAFAFIHTATEDNIVGFGHTTEIDHPLTNNNPNAILLVTQNWNPGGVGGTYNNAPIGVWYNNLSSKWAIFNQYDPSNPPPPTMEPGAAFNVMVLTECDLSCTPCSCHEVDYSGDGDVNLIDFSLLSKSWLEHELLVDLAPPSAVVDIDDLAEFARHWLEHCE